MKFIVNTSIFEQSRDETGPNFKYKLKSKKTDEFLYLI